jgi:hypothetical protein
MAVKKRVKKLNGFAIQFLPYHEIRDMDSNERIRKILEIVLGNNILILQGRLKPIEETRLIGDTMAMIGHVKGFKGIELAVISDNYQESFLNVLKRKIANALEKGDLSAITIIGPASVVKEIKKNPKKIELLLNK